MEINLTKEQVEQLASEFAFLMLTDSYVRGEARDRILFKFFNMIGYKMYPDTPSPELAEAAYEVAVQECGAPADDDTCARWVAYTQQESPSHKEFRVCHLLGGGGKLRYSYHNGFYINMYPEDKTPSRVAMEQKANKRLDEINSILREKQNGN